MFKKKNQDADGESQQDKWGSDKYSHSRAVLSSTDFCVDVRLNLS
jgi:hypothetical protein